MTLSLYLQGGVGKVANILYRPRTVAIDVLLSFNFAVVFNFNVFPFPSSKPQFLGDVPMNRLAQQIVPPPPLIKIFVIFCVREGDKDSEEMEMARKMEMEIKTAREMAEMEMGREIQRLGDRER
jgi:hypothetical protein